MRHITTSIIALVLINACASSEQAQPAAGAKAESTDDFKTLGGTFADIAVLRYQIPGFEELSPKQKEMLFYLYEAARAGRDIMFDQNHENNLAVRRTLDAIVGSYKGDRSTPEFEKVHTYAQQVWFANGIHHHYSSQKFEPEFSRETFATLVQAVDPALLPLAHPSGEGKRSVEELVAFLTPIIFDPTVSSIKTNRAEGVDLVKESANNYYGDVTQAEVEEFYADRIDKKDPNPISWGLNSKLVKENGVLVEKVYKVGGMYSAAIEKIVFWLEKASALAENPKQKDALDKLITFYKTGDLKDFDAYNIAWVNDTESRIDLVNGFIETYGDPLGYRASWESVVSIRDLERTKRIATIGAEAQWFEDHSPIADEHKKKEVKGISAKVITVVAEGGDAAPSTPIGINLPNAGWIRKEHGSKSVFLGNIVDAYQDVLADSGVLQEFTLSPETVARAEKHGGQGSALKVDMHEVIGHASGQINEGVGTPKETLKAYASALEEARADLVGLYYVMDQKLIDLGVMESFDVGKAAYDGYIRNGLLVQLARIKAGDNIQQSHMRNRQLVSKWAYEHGKKDNVIERVEKDGNIYFEIRDYQKLRELFGQLLKEVQRVKSTGDYEAGKNLIETYGVIVDREVHDNVLARYAKLNTKPYMGFIQPKLVPVKEGDAIVDVKVEYPTSFTEQNLEYGKDYSFLPTYN